MSRAMNLTLSEDEVRTTCEILGISISALVPLLDGGCHLVTVNGAGAEALRHKFAEHLIAGRVPRFAFFRR